MRIYYPAQSSFLKGCEDAIRQNKELLAAGTSICVKFSPQGYNDKIRVNIEKTNAVSFWAEWENPDSTRFPARIKAAAYALFRQGWFGEFMISHDTGTLTIQYLDHSIKFSHNDSQIPRTFERQRKERRNYKSSYISVSKPTGHNLEKDVNKCISVAKTLYERFNESEVGIFGQTDMPEEILPKSINKGSYEHLMFITLTVAIDYQRDASELWKASRLTINDKDTRWIFLPKEVLKKSENELIDAMQKYRLSGKPVKDALKIWKPVSESFYNFFNSDPRNLLKESNYNAPKLFELMTSKYKSSFPYLSGKKILPLWIRMMHEVVGIELKGIEKTPIPVDIHVARATFCIGGLKGKYRGNIQEIFNEIDNVWKDACDSLPYYRLQLDEPLWRLSKHGCTNRHEHYCNSSKNCPVSQYCISGKVYVSANKVEIDTYKNRISKGGFVMEKLVIVQCGQKKIWDNNPNLGPTEASKAYISQYFKFNREYAEKFGDNWLILSAKYGFIDPDQKIDTYNVSFKKRSSYQISDNELISQVNSKKLGEYDTVVVLGGEEYYQKVKIAFANTNSAVKSPLRGLQIGLRMSKVKDAIANGKELEVI